MAYAIVSFSCSLISYRNEDMWSLRSLGILQAVAICTHICSGSFLEENFHLQHGVYLQNHLYNILNSRSLIKCAAQCLMSSVCLSFNYNKEKQICHLNDNNTDVANVKNGSGFIYGQRPVRCGDPPRVTGASIQYGGDDLLSAQAAYTCSDDYIYCHDRNTSVCQATGQWEDVSGLCGQFRWHNPNVWTKQYIPCGPNDNFEVRVLATPTDDTRASVNIYKDTDTLLHADFRIKHFSFINTTHLTSKINDIWAGGINIPTNPSLSSRRESEVRILLQADIFSVRIDGVFLAEYPHNSPQLVPAYISVGGDVSVRFMEIIL